MKAHVLQHVPFEGPGSIAGWLGERGADIGRTRLFAGDPLPDPASVDLLVVMGGPMSVNDEGRHPWLAGEKRSIREAAERGVAVLGICLGAQLIASALGARVFPNPVKEIGWFPVRAVPAPAGSLGLPAACEAFHWHGETFDLPPGAVRLAESDACRNQAFQFGRRVVGLQFHLETTEESARGLVEHCRDELVPGPFVQGEEQLLSAPASRYREINEVMARVLSWLTAGGAAPTGA
jgi:GMP synthase-like glutamine amidotransferase